MILPLLATPMVLTILTTLIALSSPENSLTHPAATQYSFDLGRCDLPVGTNFRVFAPMTPYRELPLPVSRGPLGPDAETFAKPDRWPAGPSGITSTIGATEPLAVPLRPKTAVRYWLPPLLYTVDGSPYTLWKDLERLVKLLRSGAKLTRSLPREVRGFVKELAVHLHDFHPRGLHVEWHVAPVVVKRSRVAVLTAPVVAVRRAGVYAVFQPRK